MEVEGRGGGGERRGGKGRGGEGRGGEGREGQYTNSSRLYSVCVHVLQPSLASTAR